MLSILREAISEEEYTYFLAESKEEHTYFLFFKSKILIYLGEL